MEKLLVKSGFQSRKQRSGSSHVVFKHPDIDMVVVLVTHGKNDILPEYQVMKAIRALRVLLGNDESL